MSQMPRDVWPDATIPLLADPYRYISRRARAMGTDIFRSRLLAQPAIFLTGAKAAAFFYAPGAFTREGRDPRADRACAVRRRRRAAAGRRAHRHRKALWLGLMEGDSLDRFEREILRAWDEGIPELTASDEADVFLHSARVITRAICRWAGVPLEPRDAEETSTMLSSMFLHAAALGPAQLVGRRNRARAQDWARRLVLARRHGEAGVDGSILATIAGWTAEDGTPIAAEAAATEVLSLLRPTVANAVYITFLAMGLFRHPEHAEAVASDAAFRHAFVQEVRRLAPFFPMLAARPVADTAWHGFDIPAGTRTILDLYGTGRDPGAWNDPDTFRPERFLRWPGNPWTPIPQGGGAHAQTHRCPGEWMTLRLMEALAQRLAASRYDVVTPDARPNYRSAPALPRGGFLITNVRPG
jgi:fatty-acid peroxygenase